METSMGNNGGATSLQSYLEDVRTRFVAAHAAAAAYIGVSATDLRERLADGDSLGDVAQLAGKGLDGLRRTVVDALRGMPARGGARLDAFAARLLHGRPAADACGHRPEFEPSFEPFLEEIAEDLIWVQGGPERLRGSGVA